MCFDPVLYYAQNKSLTEKERYDIVELVIKNKPIPVKQRGIRSNQGSGKKDQGQENKQKTAHLMLRYEGIKSQT